MANLWQEVNGSADTGGLWDHLDDQMTAAPAPAAGLGLWGQIVIAQANGIWDAADNETMLLERPELDRVSVWDQAQDETLILPQEGLVAVWDAVLAEGGPAGEWDLANTITMRRPDLVEDMWSRANAETMVITRPERGGLYQAALESRSLATWYPCRKDGFAEKHLTDQSGTSYWIIKNLRADTYVRLSDEQKFIWDALDGKNSVQDIALAYMIEYGKLAINSLILLLDQLQSKGFIEDPLLDVYGAVGASMASRRANAWWRRALGFFLNHEFALHGIDGFITRTYQAGGRLLFTRVAALIFLLLSMGGAAAFFFHMRGGVYSVFTGAGNLVIVGAVTLYVLQFITLLIHEWAHAVTTKHFGREVRKGGFMLYVGMPAAFVDTTDIWMSPRQERLLVSWAGPYSGFILGGLASLLIFMTPDPFARGVLYQFAFLTYLTSFMNMNPLLKLDGYYILMDWLEIPRLREKSLAFVSRDLWRKVRAREALTRDERVFAVFGLLSLVWTAFALLLALQLWGRAVLEFLGGLWGLFTFV